jgi:hypothetical protein
MSTLKSTNEIRLSAEDAAYKLAGELFFKEGIIPRPDNIKKILGYGSNTSINEGLKKWFSDHHARFLELNSRPGMSDELFKQLNSLMDIAYKEASKIFKAERELYIGQVNELKNKIDLLNVEKIDLHKLRESDYEKISALEKSLKDCNALMDQLRAEYHDRIELADATARTLRDSITKLEKVNSEKDLTILHIKSEGEKLILREKDRYDAMEKRLIEQMNKAENDKYKAEARNEKLQEKITILNHENAVRVQKLNDVIAKHLVTITQLQKSNTTKSVNRRRTFK